MKRDQLKKTCVYILYRQLSLCRCNMRPRFSSRWWRGNGWWPCSTITRRGNIVSWSWSICRYRDVCTCFSWWDGIRAGRRTLFKSGLFSVWSYRREVQKVNRRIFLFSIAIVDPLLPNLMIKRPGLLSRWWRLWSSSTTRTSSISTSSPRTWCWSIWALLTSFCKSIFYSIYFIFHSTCISF